MRLVVTGTLIVWASSGPTVRASSMWLESGVHNGDGDVFPGFSITSDREVTLTDLTIEPSGTTSAGSTVGTPYTFDYNFDSEAISEFAYAHVGQIYGIATDFNYVSSLQVSTDGESAQAFSSFLFTQAFDLEQNGDVTYAFDYWTTFLDYQNTVDAFSAAYGVASYSFGLFGVNAEGVVIAHTLSDIFTVDSRLSTDEFYGQGSLSLNGISSGYITAYCESFASADLIAVPEVTSTFTTLGLITSGLMLRRRTRHWR